MAARRACSWLLSWLVHISFWGIDAAVHGQGCSILSTILPSFPKAGISPGPSGTLLHVRSSGWRKGPGVPCFGSVDYLCTRSGRAQHVQGAPGGLLTWCRRLAMARLQLSGRPAESRGDCLSASAGEQHWLNRGDRGGRGVTTKFSGSTCTSKQTSFFAAQRGPAVWRSAVPA